MGNALQFFDSKSPVESRLKMLETVIISMAQEIATLRHLIDAKPERYKEERREVMVCDHGGPGASPHQYYSWYRHFLTEHDFLREVLNFRPEDLKKFDEDVERREQMS